MTVGMLEVMIDEERTKELLVGGADKVDDDDDDDYYFQLGGHNALRPSWGYEVMLS